MNLNELRDQSYEIAKSKGWHDEDAPRATFGDRIALMISELAEALEEYRRGVPPGQIYWPTDDPPPLGSGRMSFQSDAERIDYAARGNKPEGIGVEIADVVIRIGDAAGAYGLDLESVMGPCPTSIVGLTETWPPVALDRLKSFGDWFAEACKVLLRALGELELGHTHSAAGHFGEAIWLLCAWARTLDIDLQHCIDVKSAYNRTRPFRHGNKRI